MPNSKERRITAREQRDLRFGRAVKLVGAGVVIALIGVRANVSADAGELADLPSKVKAAIPTCVGAGCPDGSLNQMGDGSDVPMPAAAPVTDTTVVLSVDTADGPVAFALCESPPHGANVLGCGANTEQVCALQTMLVTDGHAVDPAEIALCAYGASTRDAVIAAQTARGLAADGLAGPVTLEALGVSS